VQVLASNHTTDVFTAELSISNATTWHNSGTLDVNSDNAGVIWSLSTVDVYQPSNPDTDFQQHQTMGTFNINMKAAQQTASPTAGGTGAAATPAGPAITGTFAEPASIGLTHRDKVSEPLAPHVPRGGLQLMVGDYRAWNTYGSFVCDYISVGGNYRSVSVSSVADANENSLHDSNLWIYLRPYRNGTRNLSLTGDLIHLLP